MKKTIFYCLLAMLTLPFMVASQNPSTDDLTLAALDSKMENLGEEMEKLGTVMESYGQEMEKYGKELEDSEGQSKSAQQKMEELGEKMNVLGEEMGKLGEIMGEYGEKMGEQHQQMMNWFFRELKNDGLISSLNGKARVIFDEKGLNVDGKNASGALFSKYKAGFEKYYGKALKPDFTLFLKGSIREKDGKIETDGTMNSDF